MALKEAVTKFKFWIVTVAAIFVGLGTLGATVDRPAWISEVSVVAQDVGALAERVAGNERANLQMQIDTVQRQVWALQDRMDERPTQDGRARLRELHQQLNRLKERLARTRG